MHHLSKQIPDIAGWAVKYGMIGGPGYEIPIKKGAFKKQNGTKVPLIWNHQGNNPENLLGDGILRYYRKQGIWFEGWFSDPDRKIVQDCVHAIRKGYIRTLSIRANQLKLSKKYLQDGNIMEVSLVLWAHQTDIFRDTLIVDLFGEALEWDPDNNGIFPVDVIQNPNTRDLMCDYCGTGLKVDENRNWPDFCPGCHMELDYKDGVLNGQTDV